MNSVLTDPTSSSVQVRVCIAQPASVKTVTLTLAPGTSVAQALGQLDLAWALEAGRVGLYGRRCAGSQILQTDDQLEVYRPLVVEPKAARRRRALHREKIRNIKKKMPIDDLTV